MVDKESLYERGLRAYNKITDHEFVKKCMIGVILIYIPLLVIGHIVASFLDPDGYSIVTNWISDLGSIAHTPAPYLYDIACIAAGILTIPFTYYMEKLLVSVPKAEGRDLKGQRWRVRLGSYAFLFSIIGNVGYIGVGIWSGDRDYPTALYGMGTHEICSALAFGGFILGALLMGLIIILYNTLIPKSIGLYGILGPLIVAIIYIIGGVPPSQPFWEWGMLFAILIWVIPLSIVVFFKEELIPR